MGDIAHLAYSLVGLRLSNLYRRLCFVGIISIFQISLYACQQSTHTIVQVAGNAYALGNFTAQLCHDNGILPVFAHIAPQQEKQQSDKKHYATYQNRTNYVPPFFPCQLFDGGLLLLGFVQHFHLRKPRLIV